MPSSEHTSFDWVQLVERFGVSVAILFFLGLCIVLTGRWAGPIIKEYINRRMDRDDKHAEAALISAKAAQSNSEMLAQTAEKSIEVQSDNANTNRHISATLDAMLPMLKRLDSMVFPHQKKPKDDPRPPH
jgi:hypothetical protein